MSGQQIGTVVGGIIGSFIPVIGTQLGATIGGIVGGMVDPTKVYGPRLSDAQTQTAMDGVPRAYGDGTFPCKGNLIWQDIVKEHKHKDDGKGSGQEQITYTYTRSYAIGVCKGPITGYKIVKRNGKVVFDARTDAELSALGYTSEQIAETRAAQAKFLKVCTFYYGTADQLPDPTMVAVKGVGNVPGYTGTAYIVLTDDETMQGEVAQYEFVVANCGERHEDDTVPATLLISGSAILGGGPHVAVGSAIATPEFVGIPQASGADIPGATPGYYDGKWMLAGNQAARISTDPLISFAEVPQASFQGVYSAPSGGPSGWLFAASAGLSYPGRTAWYQNSVSGFEPYEFATDFPPGVQYRAEGDEIYILAKYVAGSYWMDSGARGELVKTSSLGADTLNLVCIRSTSGNVVNFNDIEEFDGALYAACVQNAVSPRWQLRRSDDGGATWPTILIDIPGSEADKSNPYQLQAGNGKLLCLSRDSATVWTSEDGFAEGHPTGIQSTDNAKKGRYIAYGSLRFFIVSGQAIGTGDKCVSTDDGITFTAPTALPIANCMGIVAGDPLLGGHLTPIPDSPGYYIDSQTGLVVGPSGTTIDVCKPTLGTVVSRQCAKRISTDVIDVSELTDEVVGFRVAAPSSPQKNIGALMPGYFFDSSEFDGTLHFPKRGGEDSFALTVDDLCERDGDLIQWERTQEPELLRKVTVAYLDPDTTYTATTQQWERRSGTVKAEGEGAIELPVVGSKDWAAQVAHKSGKVAWAEPDKCTFHTSVAKAALVTAAVGTITDEAGTIHRVRIERIEDEGLVRMVEARRTRADVYVSTVTGASKPLPLFPGSNIRGPTDGLLLNLPVIVDANDVPGIAWAAAGFLPAWSGGTLQFLRAGQWVDAGTVTLPATMGTLLAGLPAHAGDVDTTNTLSVRMNGDLESVTFTNLLQERNPLAILYPDGTAEIVQFQTATEVAAGEYDLTTLIRGRLNTERGDHAIGARAVFLDNSVQYASLQPTDVGTTLTYRFVSLGTDPDAAPVQTLDLTTMQSQTEWPVSDLAVEQNGDDYTLTWLARDRLGTDVFPIRSTNWRGYEVSWSYGGNTHTETVLTESVTFNLPGASDITFSVSQLNLYTGAGPAETVTIP